MKKEMIFHTMDVEEVIRSLHSSPEGLAESEVKKEWMNTALMNWKRAIKEVF